MVAYRFCRTSDIPLLIRAVNGCYDVHFGERAPMDEAAFKTAMREIDLWPSSCMVAVAGDEPIGVCLATKRETESLIYMIGVRPEDQRQGHGRHLLDSLSQKLSVLGPPKLLAEAPADRTDVCRFFEACGYRETVTYYDWVMGDAIDPLDAGELVARVGLDELIEHRVLDEDAPRCWERSMRTLVNRKDRLEALAVATGERIEAYLLYLKGEGGRPERIVELGCRASELAEDQLRVLLRSYCGTAEGVVRLPKVSRAEPVFPYLQALGFQTGREHVGYEAVAKRG